MKNKILLALVCFSVLFASCKKWIEIDPQQSLPVDKALVSVKDHKAALYGTYALLRSSSYYGQDFSVLADIMTDNVSITTANNGQYTFLYNAQFNSNTSEVKNFWAVGYRVIANANNIINSIENKIDKKIFDDSQKKQAEPILGEAYALRALAYFDLVRVFASRYEASTAATTPGIPVVLTTERDIQPSRSTVAEVYDRVIKDFDKAYSLIKQEDNIRITTSAVQGLLTRVYLTMGDYTKLETAYNLIPSKDLTLATTAVDYEKIWTESLSPEIMFKVKVTAKDGGPTIGWVYWYAVKERPDYVATDEVIGLYSASDYRSTVCYKKEDDRNTVRKYVDNPSIGLSGVNDIKVLRSAEVKLNVVEAYLYGATPNLGEATKLLDELYDARVPGNTEAITTMTIDQAKDFYQKERRRELSFEGHRWFDLKRNGLGYTRIPTEGAMKGKNVVVEADSKYWNWPIPQTEINANKNIEQDSKW